MAMIMTANSTTTLLLISDLVLKSNWSDADLTAIFELLIDYLQYDLSLEGNLQPPFKYFLPSDYVSNNAALSMNAEHFQTVFIYLCFSANTAFIKFSSLSENPNEFFIDTQLEEYRDWLYTVSRVDNDYTRSEYVQLQLNFFDRLCGRKSNGPSCPLSIRDLYKS
jgi:hypothetical protein